jgi:hypothetical protein
MSQIGKRAIHLAVDSRIKQICRRVCEHSVPRPISKNQYGRRVPIANAG